MKKLAIIGSGIAGMSAAHFMKNDYEITLIEKNNYIGGHTNTVTVHDGEKECPLDTGFMVFNETTYPYLVKLFNEIKVPYKDTDMSFSVFNQNINLEYNGSSFDGLFAQRKNFLNFRFIKMIKEILKFNSESVAILENPKFQSMTIKEYIDYLGLSTYFFDNFLVPMSSAVWSTPVEKMGEFPAQSLVRFFHNHGFVGVNTQLQWKTVIGGSREYRDRIIAELNSPVMINSKVLKVIQNEKDIDVVLPDQTLKFDKVIIASHGDEALAMLANPTDKQQEILSKFSYQKNIATVHTDTSVMPKLKKNWSSWNFIIKDKKSYTVYYMNRLQGVSEKENFFVNINGEEFVNPKKVIQTITYHHPLFDIPARIAQEKIDDLNKNTNLHFTGSYYRYGFHEDALLSSVNLCSAILGRNVL
jgi:predicted NAD/FAD-binding protein